jgi:hypothetical protein
MLWYSCADGLFPGQTGDYRVGRSGTSVRANFEGDEREEDGITAVAARALGELQDYIGSQVLGVVAGLIFNAFIPQQYQNIAVVHLGPGSISPPGPGAQGR